MEKPLLRFYSEFEVGRDAWVCCSRIEGLEPGDIEFAVGYDDTPDGTYENWLEHRADLLEYGF